ncbi:MFS transporter [Liquorilactobacillus satsumensis]|uniref:MFS transporter n=1 Tax=Liquorilactobacillus TaxID=2767888 RepID=UPI0021C27611|nr:MFS transporter [Liquorilactobacillus satsumensis]
MRSHRAANSQIAVFIIIGLFFGVFVIGADSFIISPLLPTIAHEFKASVAETSASVTIYAFCYALGAPFFGPLGDRVNKRLLLMTGILIFLTGTLLCALANKLALFYMYRALAGIGASIFLPNVWAFIGDFFSGKQLNQAVGIVMSALSLSIAIGVPLGTTLSQLSDWHMAFWGSALLTLVCMLVLFFTIPKNLSVIQHPKNIGYFNSFSTVLSTPNAVPALLITLFWMFGFYSVYTFLGTFIVDTFKFNTATTGYIFIAYGLSNFCASFFGGKVMNYLGKKRSVLTNGGVSLLVMLVIAFWGNNLGILLLALILLALTQGFGVTALQAYIVNVVPSNRATVMSINSSFLYLGLTLGSLLGGLLLKFTGFKSITILAAFGFLLALLITLKLSQQPNRKP